MLATLRVIIDTYHGEDDRLGDIEAVRWVRDSAPERSTQPRVRAVQKRYKLGTTPT